MQIGICRTAPVSVQLIFSQPPPTKTVSPESECVLAQPHLPSASLTQALAVTFSQKSYLISSFLREGGWGESNKLETSPVLHRKWKEPRGQDIKRWLLYTSDEHSLTEVDHEIPATAYCPDASDLCEGVANAHFQIRFWGEQVLCTMGSKRRVSPSGCKPCSWTLLMNTICLGVWCWKGILFH